MAGRCPRHVSGHAAAVAGLRGRLRRQAAPLPSTERRSQVAWRLLRAAGRLVHEATSAGGVLPSRWQEAQPRLHPRGPRRAACRRRLVVLGALNLGRMLWRAHWGGLGRVLRCVVRHQQRRREEVNRMVRCALRGAVRCALRRVVRAALRRVVWRLLWRPLHGRGNQLLRGPLPDRLFRCSCQRAGCQLVHWWEWELWRLVGQQLASHSQLRVEAQVRGERTQALQRVVRKSRL